MKANKQYFCPNCGDIGVWDDFCSNCGTKREPIKKVNDKEVI